MHHCIVLTKILTVTMCIMLGTEGGGKPIPVPRLLRALELPVPQMAAQFGRVLAGVGDIDGDGVPDLAVGAPDEDVNGRVEQGQAYVFSGATGVLLRTLRAPMAQTGAAFGAALVGLGDINGDGVPDLAVGAPFQEVDGQDVQGEVFVFALQTPSVVNALVTLARPVQTKFVPTPVADGPSGTFTMTVTLTNTSSRAIRSPAFMVRVLSRRNLLLNADDGAEGVGALLTPEIGDHLWFPGEAVTADFVIGLRKLAPFRFRVDLLGLPTDIP